MSQIRTTDDIRTLGTILGVWAHPDDETFSMGGLMAAAAANGQTVACITATRGELGVQDESRWPAAELADIRERELRAALDILGVTKHEWLGYADGSCEAVQVSEAVARIAELIKSLKPDTIISFGPDGMTGHADHIATCNWALRARDAAGSQARVYHAIQTKAQYDALKEADKAHNIFFNIEQPRVCDSGECDICFVLPDDIYDKKVRALAAMPSQTDGLLSSFGDVLRESEGTEAFVLAST